MKKFILSLFIFFTYVFSYSQCTIQPIATQNTIDCNDSIIVTFNAFAQTAINESFNASGTQDTCWTYSAAAIYTNPYIPSPPPQGSGAANGGTYFWMGATNILPTSLETCDINTIFGGQICYDMVYANGTSAPIEQPDEYDEGVSLQYSLDGGTTWVDIVYLAPVGDTLVSCPLNTNVPNVSSLSGPGPYEAWNRFCWLIPPGASASSVRFRWVQLANSGACCDHWGLDNIQIYVADTAYSIINPDGAYVVDSTYDVVYPTSDSTLTYMYTNGSNDTCYGTVDVFVNPTDAGPDIYACKGVGHELHVDGVAPWGNVSWTPTTGLSCLNCLDPYANPPYPPNNYTYTVTSDCGVDDVTLFLVDSFDVQINLPDTICVGGDIQLTATTSPAGVGISSYQWGPSFMLNNSSQQTVIATPATTSDIYVTVTNTGGCSRSDTVTAYVDVHTIDIEITPSDSLICLGDSVDLYPTIVPPSNPYIISRVPYIPKSPTGPINSITFPSANSVLNLSLGFSFPFYGTNYTSFTLSSNGWLSFTTQTNNYSGNVTIPNVAVPNNIVAFLWDNLDVTIGSGQVTSYTLGTAPNRIFVIEFLNVQSSTGGGLSSVQVELHETTGVIQINNISVSTGTSTTTQGIENLGGTSGQFIPGHNNTTFAQNQYSWQFIPYSAPSSINYVWSPNYNILDVNADTATVYPTQNYTYQVTAESANCSSSAQYEVQLDIYDVIASPVGDTICPGELLQLNGTINGAALSCSPDYFVYDIPYYKEFGTATPITFSGGTTPYDNGYSSTYINLPFPFSFYCKSVTGTRVNTNGYLSFVNGGISSASNTTIPSTSQPTDFIALMWDDLIDSAGTTGYFTTGTTPNRKFVVEFNQFHKNDSYASAPVKGQIILFENTNVIDIICENCQAASTSPTATQGIEALVGANTLGIATPGRNNTGWSAQQSAYRFYPKSTLNTDFTMHWTPIVAITGDTTQFPLVNPTTDQQYILAISNNNNCTYRDTLNVYVSNNLSVNAGNDITICAGESVTINTVSAANMFAWTPNDGSLNDTTLMSPTASPTVSTTYYVEASKSTCVAFDTVTVNVIDFNIDSTSVIDEICIVNSGSITIHASGQTAGLQYSINNGTTFQTSNVFSGLSGGTYDIVVGTTNCDTTFSVTVVGGAALLAFDSINILNSVCNAPGSIDIYTSGGTAPIQYSIDNGTTLSNQTYYSNLIAGNYNVVVIDSFGCQLDSTVSITATATLGLTVLSTTDATSFGQTDGSATLTTSGGVSPFNFSLDSATWQTNGTFNSLAAGTYDAYVYDANGCTDTTSFVIYEPDSLYTNITAPGNVLCAGGTIDSLTAITIGGTMPYTYLWNTSETTKTIQNIVFGTYWVQVTDANNYSTTDTIIISQPIPLYLTTLTDSVYCGGENTGLTYVDSASGGVPNYTYQWSNSANVVIANNDSAINLFAGTYYVIMTDFNNCTISDTVQVFEPTPLTVTLVADTLSCFGDANACITATPSGGSAPYSIAWNNGATSFTICNLSAGWYWATTTDSRGCTSIDSIEVIEPTALALDSSFVNVTCKGLNNGSATVLVSGGTANYSYAWNDANNQSLATAANLVAGTYQVVVTDANLCMDSLSVSITEPADSLLLSLVSVTDVLCNGGATGNIQVSTSGGTPNYSYSWSNGGGANEDLLNATAGTYTLTVTDANNCTNQLTATINQPTAVGITFTQVNIDCYSASSGSIDATVSGGVGAYSFAWTGPNGFTASTEDISTLAAGTYVLTATDSNNCPATQTVILTQPQTVSIAFNVTDVSCFGGSDGSITASVASGGTAPFNFSWNDPAMQNNATANNLSEGTYTVTVTDNNGCQYTDSTTVNQPNTPLTLAIDSTDITCAGYNDGTATVFPTGGTPGYSFLWSDALAQTNATATGLAPGVVSVTVTDANGCAESISTLISEPTPLNPSALADSAGCWGENTGVIYVQSGGGTGVGYVYSIDGGETFSDDSIFTGLAAGIYDEIVIMDLGSEITCISQPISVTVYAPPYFFVSINPEDTTLQLEESVTLALVVQAPYDSSDVVQIMWYPTTGLNCSDCVNPTVLTYEHYTEYTATINYQGASGYLCNQTATAIINVENNLQLFIPNAFTPGGFDTYNDNFEVFGEGIEYMTMQIYNRWGEKIFESSNQRVTWDGTYQGVLQNPGVYTYYVSVEYLDGKTIEKKGSVTLLR